MASPEAESWRARRRAWRRAFLRAVGVDRAEGVREDVEEEGFVIRETKEAWRMRCLSSFVSRKVSVTAEVGRCTLRGARGLARRSVALRRRGLRFAGAEGAWKG